MSARKPSRREIGLINMTDPRPTLQATRKATRLNPSPLPKPLPSTSVHAPASHALLDRPKTTSSKTHSGPSPAEVKLKDPTQPLPTDKSANTTNAPESTSEQWRAQIPEPSDPVLLQVTDPEEIAKRNEELEIPEGHKLVHFLRHGTSWRKYISVFALR